MSVPSPQRLGDFEIVRQIGRGGMGVVYEARQVSLNRKVALKVLSGGLGLTPNAVQRFHREAEAAAKLHHTNDEARCGTGRRQGRCSGAEGFARRFLRRVHALHLPRGSGANG
jgi:serine/threonine protein kinase